MSKPDMNPAAQERRFIVRAGLFVAMALGLGALVILLIGKERRFFDEQITYKGAFDNVDGLQLDAPVRLGGLDVGRVSSIAFAHDLDDKRIIVQLQVSAKFSERVREDSVARVTSRGVLGDKAVDISLGSPDAPLIKNWGEIKTGSSGDLSSLMKAAGEIIDNSVAITRDLKVAVASYTDPELRKDISGLVKSARKITQEIETGEGALHALVYDKRTSTEFKTLVASLSSSAGRLDAAIGQAEQILKDVREGEGPAHAIIYDKKAAQAL
ncbi:MAG: MlaD family protein, partial [Myxococcaceae bacterium]